MSTAIDLTDKKIIKNGPMPKTGGEYLMFMQSADNLPQIMALQEKVFAGLSEDEKSFILHKDEDFFKKHFANGGLVIGIAHNGQLVAQSIILHPDSAHPRTGMVDMALPADIDKLSIIQGVMVDPAYRGNLLMKRMVDGWLLIAEESGRNHLIAEVTVENHYSWAVFLKEGLKIHSLGLDASDGTNLYNMHAAVPCLMQRRLSPDFNKAAAKDATPCPRHDLDQQKKLVADGYRGVAFDPEKQILSFRKSGPKPPAP